MLLNPTNLQLMQEHMNREAEKRRQALWHFMAERKLKRGTLTRLTGISPNIIYNFLNGKSTYLSQPTLDRIAEVFDVPVSSLTGAGQTLVERHAALRETGADMKGNAGGVPLAGALTTLKVAGTIIEGRLWSETIFVEADTTEIVSFNLPSLYSLRAFALKLASTAMEAMLPNGAMLGCVLAADYLQRLRSGDIVIVVRRNKMGLFQTSVRQYVVEGARHYVSSRPAGKIKAEKMELTAPIEDPTALGQQDFFIHAIVLAYTADLPASRR